MFISLLLFVFGIAAKGTYMLVGKVVQPQDIALVIHFFPWRAPRGCARSSSRPGAIAWWAC
ncbi:MAG: hypothetical protein ACLSAH_22560 [Bilophila wadsworthia]